VALRLLLLRHSAKHAEDALRPRLLDLPKMPTKWRPRSTSLGRSGPRQRTRRPLPLLVPAPTAAASLGQTVTAKPAEPRRPPSGTTTPSNRHRGLPLAATAAYDITETKTPPPSRPNPHQAPVPYSWFVMACPPHSTLMSPALRPPMRRARSWSHTGPRVWEPQRVGSPPCQTL
jgi:hypothetical protein